MADVAAIFHWSLEALGGMDLAQLMRWRALAIDRAIALAEASRPMSVGVGN